MINECDEQINSEQEQSHEINKFIVDNIERFGINSNGLCRHCSIFNVNLGNVKSGDSQNLEDYLLKTVENNKEYCKIITSIKLQDDQKALMKKQKVKNSMSLNKALLESLPCLANISIKHITVTDIDHFIKECKNLKNIRFVQTDLKQLSPDLFDMKSTINQIDIDNNPILEIPSTLFTMQSLRSLSLRRLNIASLPDTWLEKLEGKNLIINAVNLFRVSKNR